MFNEEEADILRVLMDDLQTAFGNKKASRALTHAQNAYMRAAFNLRVLERSRQRKAQIIGSQEDRA